MTSAKCESFQEHWDDLRISRLGDELGDELSADLEAHLTDCPACREYVETLRGIQSAVDSVEMDPLLRRRLAVAASEPRHSQKRSIPLRWAWAAIPVAAAALAVFALLPPGNVDSANNAEPQIATRHGISSRTVHEAAPGDAAFVSSTSDGRRVIELFPGTALWLDGETAVQAHLEGENTARFTLSQGRVVAEIGAHKPGFRFIVDTPLGEVEARGTLFSVEVKSDDDTVVRVAEGSVEVRPKDSTKPRHLLTGGQELPIGVDAPVPANADDIQKDRCLALAECTETAEEEPVIVSKGEIRKSRTSRDDSPSSNPATKRAVSAIEQRRFDEAASLIEEVAAARPRAGVTRDLLAKLARAYRRAKLFGPAAGTYRRLIQEFPGSEAATNGLVALAQIELNTLGQADDALHHFEEYLLRSPRGYLCEAARAGRVRALSVMGRNTKITRAVGDYLGAHPQGFFVAEMLCRRADAQVRLGNCPAALRDYHRVLEAWPGSREAKKAARGLGACGETPGVTIKRD